MPLEDGSTLAIIETNIRLLMASGKRTRAEAAVIATRKAAGPKK